MIKINYFEHTAYFTDKILGHIVLEGITEIITPLFKDDIDIKLKNIINYIYSYSFNKFTQQEKYIIN